MARAHRIRKIVPTTAEPSCSRVVRRSPRTRRSAHAGIDLRGCSAGETLRSRSIDPALRLSGDSGGGAAATPPGRFKNQAVARLDLNALVGPKLFDAAIRAVERLPAWFAGSSTFQSVGALRTVLG